MAEFLFGALAFLALLGWGVTNALTSRNHFREAQALDMEERVNARIDDRVSTVVNRYREIMAGKKVATEWRQPTVLTDAEEARREAVRQGLSMTGDMPEMAESAPAPGRSRLRNSVREVEESAGRQS